MALITCPIHHRRMTLVSMKLPKFACSHGETLEKYEEWRSSRKVWKCPVQACPQYGPSGTVVFPPTCNQRRARRYLTFLDGD